MNKLFKNRFKTIIFVFMEFLYKTFIIAIYGLLIRLLIKIPHFSFVAFLLICYLVVMMGRK